MHQNKDVSNIRNKAAGNALLNLSGGAKTAAIGSIFIVLMILWGYVQSKEKQTEKSPINDATEQTIDYK